jgi:hypothetical protein
MGEWTGSHNGQPGQKQPTRCVPSTIDPTLFRPLLPKRVFNTIRYHEAAVVIDYYKEVKVMVVTAESLYCLPYQVKMAQTSSQQMIEPLIKHWHEVDAVQSLKSIVNLFDTEEVNAQSHHLIVWTGLNSKTPHSVEFYTFERKSSLFYHIYEAWMACNVCYTIGAPLLKPVADRHKLKHSALFDEIEEEVIEIGCDDEGRFLKNPSMKVLQRKQELIQELEEEASAANNVVKNCFYKSSCMLHLCLFDLNALRHFDARRLRSQLTETERENERVLTAASKSGAATAVDPPEIKRRKVELEYVLSVLKMMEAMLFNGQDMKSRVQILNPKP